MKKFQTLIWAVVVSSSSLVMAQPPEEELSPTAPEFNIEVIDAPTPSEPVAPVHAQAIQPILPTVQAKIPIVEAKKPEAPKEDKSIKGITLSPAVTLKPLGYNGERDQTFVEVSPAAGLAATFKTAGGRDVTLNAGYAFTWDEFLTNRAKGLRYFEHDLTGDATINWTDSFATKMSGQFNYSLWASDNREYSIFNEDMLQGIFKVNSQVSITTGYRLFYFNDLDTQFHLSDGTLPSDGDDIRQGNSALGGSDPTFLDPNGTTFNYDPSVGNVWFANNALQLKTKFKATDATSLGLEYEYVFMTFSNTDTTMWKGHFIVASISQNMPWKGGTVSLKDQVRLRNYDFKSNDDGNLASNFRNRVTLVVDQALNDTITAELWYRWEMSGSNADNYAVKKNQHQINLGFTFAF